jgi:hypothetical protein
LVDSASEMLHRPQNWLARVAAASMMSVRHEGHMLCASFAYEAERVHAARHCRWKLCPQRRVSLPVGSGRRQMAQSAAAPAGCVLFGCCTGSPAGLPPSSTSILPALAPHNRAPAPSPAMVAPGWRMAGAAAGRVLAGWLRDGPGVSGSPALLSAALAPRTPFLAEARSPAPSIRRHSACSTASREPMVCRVPMAGDPHRPPPPSPGWAKCTGHAERLWGGGLPAGMGELSWIEALAEG